jgi:hypothetical protein
MCYLDCMPTNPFRTPDFRWLRASHLSENGGRLHRKWDDRWIRRARDFLRQLNRLKRDLNHPRLARLDPAILGAYRVRFDNDERFRWQLEARVVGEQPIAQIAERTGPPVDVIDAYESLFFDVRDSLDATDWVATFVLGPRLYEGFGEQDIDLVWKLVAYGFGYYGLEALLETVYGEPPVIGLGGTELGAEVAAGFRRAVALRSVPITEATAPLLIRLHQRLWEIEREATSGSIVPVFRPLRIPRLELLLALNPSAIPADTCVAGAGTAPKDGDCGDQEQRDDVGLVSLSTQSAVGAAIDEFCQELRKLA